MAKDQTSELKDKVADFAAHYAPGRPTGGYVKTAPQPPVVNPQAHVDKGLAPFKGTNEGRTR